MQDRAALIKLSNFTCPISGEIFNHPKVANPCGHSFEEEMVQEWRQKHKNECPCCRKTITSLSPYPFDIKNSLKEALAQHPEWLSEQYLSNQQIDDTIHHETEDAYFYNLVKAKQKGAILAAALANRATQREKQTNIASALTDLDKAIELDPTNPMIYMQRADLQHRQKTWDNAISDYTQAIQLNPDNAFAYHNRGFTKFSKHDFDGAISDLQKSIKLSSSVNIKEKSLLLLTHIQQIKNNRPQSLSTSAAALEHSTPVPNAKKRSSNDDRDTSEENEEHSSKRSRHDPEDAAHNQESRLALSAPAANGYRLFSSARDMQDSKADAEENHETMPVDVAHQDQMRL